MFVYSVLTILVGTSIYYMLKYYSSLNKAKISHYPEADFKAKYFKITPVKDATQPNINFMQLGQQFISDITTNFNQLQQGPSKGSVKTSNEPKNFLDQLAEAPKELTSSDGLNELDELGMMD